MALAIEAGLRIWPLYALIPRNPLMLKVRRGRLQWRLGGVSKQLHRVSVK
ncbi:hypothetical protein LCGC14_2216910, partial [marine sediment metagenome]